MKLYVYNKSTKEYLGCEEARLDPLESAKRRLEVYVIPPFTTPIPPQETTDNKVNVFNEATGMWELIEDNRGLEVFDKKGESFIITELGEVPSGYSKSKPFNLQIAKIELITDVNLSYLKAQTEEVTVGDFTGNLESKVHLQDLKNFIGDAEFGAYDVPESNSVILTRETIEFLIKYFYVRSILLAIRKNEIIKKIKSAKSKKQLEAVSINFDVLSETKKIASKTEEEISEYIRKKLV